MKTYNIETLYRKRNTGKVRKYLSKLIFNNPKFIRLCRTFAIKDNNPQSKTFGRAISDGIKTVKYFKYVKPDGPKGRTQVDPGKQVPILVKRPNGYSDEINIAKCAGYYPHVFFKNEWRPLFLNKVERRLTAAEYYADLQPVREDVEFWCLVNKPGKRSMDKNKKSWFVVKEHDKRYRELVGGR